MKKLLFLFIVPLILSSCSSSIAETDIPGTWTVVGYDPTSLKDISEEIVEGGRKEAMSTVYEFKDDFTFKMTSGALPGGLQGEWKYVPGNPGEIIFISPDPHMGSEGFYVTESNASSMKWTQTMGEFGHLTMTLSKQ